MERDVDLGTGYAFKRLLLGRPLATSRLEHERLGRPTALAVFSSDNMSSVAYATEEILRVLIPVVGIVLNGYLLYKSFFVALWAEGWRMGLSIIVTAVSFMVCAAGYTLLTLRRSAFEPT